MGKGTNAIDEKVKKITKGAKLDEEKMERIFYFIRDEIRFDFVNPFLSAENVLKQGHGSCMNKALLLVAMAKSAGIPARLHFSIVTKEALRDLIPPFLYKRWMSQFLHAYAETKLKERWVPLDATFDDELHRILLKKELNFARYSERRNISNDFSPSGVVGAQMLCLVEDAGFSDDFTPFNKFLPLYVRLLMPLIMRRSRRYMKKVRSE